MDNIYQHGPNSPYHLSVGALVVDAQGRFAAQRFDELEVGGTLLKDLCMLMRETPESNETLLEAFHRGLREEMGIEADPEAFLGTLVSRVEDQPPWEKTTIYILGGLVSQDEARRTDTALKYVSEVFWSEPQALKARLAEQAERINRSSFNETKIVDRAIRHLGSP